MEKKQKNTKECSSAYLSKPRVLNRQGGRWLCLLQYLMVKNINAQGLVNIIENGGETESGEEKKCCNMLSSRLEGQCAYGPTRPAQDQAS